MINQEELEDFIFISALENAIHFDGVANPKALIGKTVGKFPEIKNDISKLNEIISKICSEVNNLSLENQKDKLKELNPQSLDKKEKVELKKKDGLPELEGTENGVVVRFEPAPSGHLHLGHLFPIVANYEFMKKYGGKFILRMADTNPDNIDIKNYEKVIEDVKWICDNSPMEIVYQSDRLEIYYKYLRQLVEIGQAYICKCDTEVFKAYTDASEMCPCQKEMSIETQIKKYDKMFSGRYKQGEAVIRAKADINNKNPALRTFPLARINESSHARVGNKYRVWPNMHLSVAIDDVLMGITHVIRGKDHEVNTERQEMIHKALNLKSPIYFHMGRMKFEDMTLSKTDLTEKIENGEFTGWDDPRVPSVLSHKKRGYKAEAFRKFILQLGISKRDSKITAEEYYKGLDYFNKHILEAEADRYFFVHNAKKVHINDLSKIIEKEIILPKHPENKSKGNRHFKLENDYYIDGIDFNNIENTDLIRLMHFANFKVISKTENELELEFVSKDFDRSLSLKRNIQFVPMNATKATIIMQDNSHLNGLVDDLDNIRENVNIQFERFGFVKYDHKEDERRIFFFTHR